MIKNIKIASRYIATALRLRKLVEHPIYLETFWDALNGQDRYNCDEYTDEDKAKKYFEGNKDQYLD